MSEQNELKEQALQFEDESGIHIIPFSSIATLAEEVGEYNYTKDDYVCDIYDKEANRTKLICAPYNRKKYTLRTVNGESFALTQELYETLVNVLYDVAIKASRKNGRYW